MVDRFRKLRGESHLVLAMHLERSG